MPFECKFKCKYEQGKTPDMYDKGLGYCTGCEKAMNQDHIRCFCCNAKLRVSPNRGRKPWNKCIVGVGY